MASPKQAPLPTNSSRNDWNPMGTEKCLTPHDYRNTRPDQSSSPWSLVVDDSGVKYIGREDAEHLIWSLQQHYKLQVDEKGALYCGITLDWDYKK